MSEIKRNLPNEKFKAAINSTATGADPNAPLSAVTNSDLEATLTRGDTTADGQVIKAENGGGQLNLRVGADNIAELTTDNGGYGTPYAYLSPDSTELTSNDGGLLFFTSGKSLKLFQKDGFNQYGVYVSAEPSIDGGNTFTGQGLFIVNNGTLTQNINPINSVLGIAINVKTAVINAGVEYSVAIGGEGTVMKTPHTAYVRQIGFHEVGAIEGLLNNRTLTQDRTWFLQNESGEIPVGPGWNTLIANPTVAEDGFIISWNNTTGEFELKADGIGSNTNLSEGISTTTTVDVNSSDGTNATLLAASTIRAGVMTKAKFDEVVANTAKSTNVSTDLSEGTSTTTTVDVNSSDGTNATLLAASTIRAGLLTKAKFDEIVANTLKASNVSTNLSVGAKTATTLDVDSSDGTNATLPAASITEAGLLQATDKVKLNATTNTNSGDEVSATDAVEGIAELATQAEVNTGTDATRIVTPDTLEDKTYGTFTGSTVTDNAVLKVIIQELEDAIEASQVKSTSVTKIADYTAVNGDFVIMTTGVADKTVFLPLTPANDEIVEVYKEDSAAGNLILNGNGETIQLLGSVAATQTITAQGESFTAQYIGTKWLIK